MKFRTLAPCLFFLLFLLITFTSTIACLEDDLELCSYKGCCCSNGDGTSSPGANGKCSQGSYPTCSVGSCNTCEGTACNGMCFATIDDNSCTGNQACQYLSDSTVESNSCNDEWSCYETQNSYINSFSCVGDWSCYKMNGLSVGSYSCDGYKACQFSSTSSSIGSYSCGCCSSGANCTSCPSSTQYQCQNLVSSSIGDNSCNSVNGSSYACQKIVNSQIGSNSCNSASNDECQYCSNSIVPDNSCNNLDGGWADSNGNFWNSCEYCTNCKIQATGAQCYVTNVTATATTTSSRRLHTNARKGKKSPDGTFDVDCVHLMETIQSFYTTLNVTGTDLAQMIPSQTKAKAVFRKKTGVCEIPLHLIFHHLESERLTSSCEALERVFTEHKEDFLINFKRFKGLKLSCIAKDINAQVITKKKKKDRKKGEGTKRGLSAASLVTHVAYPMDDAMDYALKSNGEKIITLDDPNY